MPKVYNRHKDIAPAGAVYIGRPSRWGNPFVVGQDGSRDEVIEKYYEYLKENPELVEDIKKELAGKDLVCYCSPLPCHGDVLLFIANEGEKDDGREHCKTESSERVQQGQLLLFACPGPSLFKLD